jgi:probable DNA metabolism protein
VSAAATGPARVDPPWDLDAWRVQARIALRAGVAPELMAWGDALDADLFAAPATATAPGVPPPATRPPSATARVPRDFLDLAETVLAHRDAARHALLYRLLWRIVHGEPGLLGDPLDPDVHRARVLEKSVRRDLHKMKAFVRFRAVPGEAEAFVAWFEPEHHILDLVSGFFLRRFAGMRWAILTPYRSVAWDGEGLAFGPGAHRADAPGDDAGEALWRAYYANIFNPARLNPRMMRQEMPQKYWKHLPETALLPGLLRDAGARVRDMAARDAEAPRKPAMVARGIASAPAMPPPVRRGAAEVADLADLRDATRACRDCPLWQPATQAVPGEGPSDARILLLGEQPGDEEDLRGRPFVGPAGRLLDRALAELGLDRGAMFVTNAVKHFKFTRGGKVRLHAKASPSEQRACRQWLERELELLQPERVVCLGATALGAMLGTGARLTDLRGQWMAMPNGARLMATVHPAWVLRQPGEAAQAEAYRGFVADLALLRQA